MRAFRPFHGVAIVLGVVAAVWTAEYALAGRGRPRHERVAPNAQGQVRLDAAGLARNQVRFYRFLNAGNQEVLFFVGRDGEGTLQVAFDAAESDYRRKRGFRHDGEWLVNNKCDTACRLAEVNAGGGGCKPVPLTHRVEGDTVLIAESDILTGWRYFQ